MVFRNSELSRAYLTVALGVWNPPKTKYLLITKSGRIISKGLTSAAMQNYTRLTKRTSDSCKIKKKSLTVRRKSKYENREVSRKGWVSKKRTFTLNLQQSIEFGEPEFRYFHVTFSTH